MARALDKNVFNIYCMVFCEAAMIVTAVFVPLLQRHGLSMAQVLQTQALFALTIAIFEVPSGYLADLWGRRNTIVAGQSLVMLSFFWFAGADGFVDFLIYEAIIGLGISLCSGADLALLYDTQSVLNERGEGTYVEPGRHIGRLVAIEGYGGAIAGILAGILTLGSLDWVLWAQCIAGTGAFVFSLHLVEAPRQIAMTPHRDNAARVLTALFARPVVLWTALAIVMFGLAALYAFWLYQKYWELQGVPLALFGYIWALHCGIRGITAHYAHAIEQRFGWERVFLFSALLPVCGFLGMGLAGGMAGLLIMLVFPVSRGLNMVIFYNALNKRLDATFRATLNSLVSLGTRGVFIVTGPLLGYLVDSRGVNVSLLFLGAVFLPAICAVLIPLAGCIRREQGGQRGSPGEEIV